MMKKVFVSVLFCVLSAAGFCQITDVTISPLAPTINNIITITTKGWETSSASVTQSIWQIDGAAITLDLYVHLGFLTVITNWSHSDTIGTLAQGNYSLTVNEIYSPDTPILPKTYTTSFAVVTPEPSTLMLFSMGYFLCKRRN